MADDIYLYLSVCFSTALEASWNTSSLNRLTPLHLRCSGVGHETGCRPEFQNALAEFNIGIKSH
jgi:hypothetical protein